MIRTQNQFVQTLLNNHNFQFQIQRNKKYFPNKASFASPTNKSFNYNLYNKTT